MKRAGWPAASIADRIAGMSLRTDVAVSTWTVRTARISCRGVGAESLLDRAGVDGATRFGGDLLDPEAVELGHLAPDRGKAATVEDEDQVTPRERVGQRHLPTGVPVADRDERTTRRPGDGGQRVEDLVDHLRQLTCVDVGHRPVHRVQDPGGHHARAWDGDDVGPSCEGGEIGHGCRV